MKILRWILFLLPIVAGVLCYVLENALSKEGGERLTVGLQFVVGNFPNSKLVDPESAWFAVAFALKFGLLYAPSYGAGAIFVRLIRLKKEQTMKFLDLLKDRDLAIEQQILNTLPVENRDKIRHQLSEAIERAGKIWAEKYLPILVGGNEAAFKALDTDVQIKHA